MLFYFVTILFIKIIIVLKLWNANLFVPFNFVLMFRLSEKDKELSHLQMELHSQQSFSEQMPDLKAQVCSLETELKDLFEHLQAELDEQKERNNVSCFSLLFSSYQCYIYWYLYCGFIFETVPNIRAVDQRV